MIPVYLKYIILRFLKSLLLVTTIFAIIILIMNLFEELSFFKDTDNTIITPIFLTVINLPSVLFDIFPFIFLINSIFYFNNLIEDNELKTLKVFGITNLKLIQILSFTSLTTGILIITIFYSISTQLKFFYLDIKNEYSKDDKYLAVITSNGLWIKDSFETDINFINAEEIDNEFLIDISISQFDKKFNLKKTINAKKANIKNKDWVLYDVKINQSNSIQSQKELEFASNFNIDKILTLFDNLSALSLLELETLKKEYEYLGYSSNTVRNYQHKIYSYPVYLTLMVMIGSIIMLKIGYNKSKIFHIIVGIAASVIIYYVNYFSSNILSAKEIPILISVWGPQMILLTLIIINLVRLNER